MAIIFVFLKEENLIIRDPLTGVPITKDGINVQSGSYWIERKRAGLIGIGRKSYEEWEQEQSSPPVEEVSNASDTFVEDVKYHDVKKKRKHNL